jgi:hypothetical protein
MFVSHRPGGTNNRRRPQSPLSTASAARMNRQPRPDWLRFHTQRTKPALRAQKCTMASSEIIQANHAPRACRVLAYRRSSAFICGHFSSAGVRMCANPSDGALIADSFFQIRPCCPQPQLPNEPKFTLPLCSHPTFALSPPLRVHFCADAQKCTMASFSQIRPCPRQPQLPN